jgi:hypothetical protein
VSGWCVCVRCDARRELLGDVATRALALPLADHAEVVILRRFDGPTYLGDVRAPAAAVAIRPGGDRGRAFLRAALGDVQAELERLDTVRAFGFAQGFMTWRRGA